MADAHESEVPQRYILEKEMDLYNNEFGLIAGDENSLLANQSLSNIVYQALLDGLLKYLSPIDYNDPNYQDDPTTPIPGDGTHGITNSTILIPSNL